MSNQSNKPTPDELAAIDAVLTELRHHYHQWPEWHADPHGMIGFAYYEGFGHGDCCDAILIKAAPFALGHRLVERHGFAWTMLGEAPPRRFAITHPLLDAPIALDSLASGEWFEPEEDHDPADEKIAGWLVYESYRKIVEKIGQRPRD